jgi:hypothetical protein
VPLPDDSVSPQARATLRRASRLLRMTVYCHLFTTFACCCGPLFGRITGTTVWLAVACKYLPITIAALASARLRGYRNRRLCLVAGVLVLCSSAWALAEAFLICTNLAGLKARDPVVAAFVLVVSVAVSLTAFATGLLGGVRTVMILNDPQVKAAFR